MSTPIDVTQRVCPDAPRGGNSSDNTTHHLVPRYSRGQGVMTCRYCGKTEKALREEAEKAK